MSLARLAVVLILMSSCSTARAAGLAPDFGPGMVPIEEIDADALKPAITKLDKLAESTSTVTLAINSFGGSIFDGQDLISHLEQLKKKTPGLRVNCLVDTRAMSMGFAILQSPACDTRFMTRRSVLLAHRGSTQVQGNLEHIESQLQLTRALDIALAYTCSKRLNITPAEYDAHVAHSDWAMGWQEALAVGAVDGVVDESTLPPVYVLDKPEMSLRSLLGL